MICSFIAFAAVSCRWRLSNCLVSTDYEWLITCLEHVTGVIFVPATVWSSRGDKVLHASLYIGLLVPRTPWHRVIALITMISHNIGAYTSMTDNLNWTVNNRVIVYIVYLDLLRLMSV